MNKNIKTFLGISAGLIMALALVILSAPQAKANPLFFPPSVSTSAATSSVAYIGVGTASSTITIDSYVAGSAKAFNRATALIQYAASSTSSVLAATVQYSQDGIDWYNDNINNEAATTTSNINLATPVSYTWKAAGTATSSTAITIQTPVRFARITYSFTGAAGAVWSQIVPEREVN